MIESGLILILSYNEKRHEVEINKQVDNGPKCTHNVIMKFEVAEYDLIN